MRYCVTMRVWNIPCQALGPASVGACPAQLSQSQTLHTQLEDESHLGVSLLCLSSEHFLLETPKALYRLRNF